MRTNSICGARTPKYSSDGDRVTPCPSGVCCCMVPANARTRSPREDADMNRQWCLAISLATLSVVVPAMAQDYPSKPIRVIASSAPGGISDIFMRAVGEELTKRWGQPIVIENRAGGGMNIGGRACAEAPPDGTTICILSN